MNQTFGSDTRCPGLALPKYPSPGVRPIEKWRNAMTNLDIQTLVWLNGYLFLGAIASCVPSLELFEFTLFTASSLGSTLKLQDESQLDTHFFLFF